MNVSTRALSFVQPNSIISQLNLTTASNKAPGLLPVMSAWEQVLTTRGFKGISSTGRSWPPRETVIWLIPLSSVQNSSSQIFSLRQDERMHDLVASINQARVCWSISLEALLSTSMAETLRTSTTTAAWQQSNLVFILVFSCAPCSLQSRFLIFRNSESDRTCFAAAFLTLATLSDSRPPSPPNTCTMSLKATSFRSSSSTSSSSNFCTTSLTPPFSSPAAYSPFPLALGGASSEPANSRSSREATGAASAGRSVGGLAAAAERNARARGADAGSATSSAARSAAESADESAGQVGAAASKGRSLERKGAGANDCGQNDGERKAWEARNARSGAGREDPAPAPAGRRRARARREWRCARDARCADADADAGGAPQREASQASLSARRRSGCAATRSQSSLSASMGVPRRQWRGSDHGGRSSPLQQQIGIGGGEAMGTRRRSGD
ncbi:hypothetical protein EE612_019991, partial [Oryza sativa]